MKTSEMYKLLQEIRILSISLPYGAILELYYDNPIVKDIIRELQTN